MKLTKICTHKSCIFEGQEQSISNFCKDRPRKDGLSYHCKSCMKQKNKQRYKDNRTKILTQNKQYSKNHPEKHRESQWKSYGIKNPDGSQFREEDYNKLYEQQEGKCALLFCNKHSSQLKIRLAVDHNHKTGIVRGLLCYNCNRNIVSNLTLEYAQGLVKYLGNNQRGL
jgi:hypothetical protein